MLQLNEEEKFVWGATLLIRGFMAWLEENWKMDKVFHFDLIGALLMLGCLRMMFFQDCFSVSVVKEV